MKCSVLARLSRSNRHGKMQRDGGRSRPIILSGETIVLRGEKLKLNS
jgi:hypothetical protein